MSLRDGCIETTARRVQREIVQALIEGWLVPAGAGAGLDTLSDFLRTADFPALRTQRRELYGDVPCRVKICRQGDGAVRCHLEGNSMIRHVSTELAEKKKRA